MADRIGPAEVRNLLQEDPSPHVSIYLPVVRFGEQAAQNAIRLKNLIVRAEGELVAQGQRAVTARHMLEPLKEEFQLGPDVPCPGNTFCLLITESLKRAFWLEETWPEMVYVGKRFYLKPFYNFTHVREPFYLLSVSMNDVHVYRGDEFDLTEIHSQKIPASFREALQLDQPEGMYQSHSAQPALRGKEGLSFHGQGGQPDEIKEEILSFLQVIERSLAEVVHPSSAPLIFAGVEYLYPLFRSVTKHPGLLSEAITGNPSRTNLADLHEQCVRIMRPHWGKKFAAAIAQYGQLQHDGRATEDFEATLQAAQRGQVETAILSREGMQWGDYNRETGTATLLVHHHPPCEDLIDLVGAMTLLNGGEVYVVEPHAVPSKRPIAALLRYHTEAISR